jgi:hypothetical protein
MKRTGLGSPKDVLLTRAAALYGIGIELEWDMTFLGRNAAHELLYWEELAYEFVEAAERVA